MFNRCAGVLVIVAMLAANSVVVWRYCIPHWMAGPNPGSTEKAVGSRLQLGIFNEENERVGTSWVITTVGEGVRRSNYVSTLGLGLPSGTSADVWFDVDLVYAGNVIDEIKIRASAMGHLGKLKGERFGDEFGCEWTLSMPSAEGTFDDSEESVLQTGRFTFDASSTLGMGDVFRPFDRLPGLEVGQSWELNLVNPLSGMLPGIGSSMVPESIIVKVVGKETVRNPVTKQLVEAFVVKDWPDGTTCAWVDGDGRVLIQKVMLPFIGELTVKDEVFDNDALQEVRASINR